jgi:outer membrane protein TolC
MRVFLVFLIFSSVAKAQLLSLRDAEQQALQSSERLKAAKLDSAAITSQESAGFSALLPRLSLQGNYTYLSTLPSLSVAPGAPAITFGDHNNYSIGPALHYTLWDSLSSWKSFQALKKLKEAREQDQASTKLQILFAVRSAYVRVQLALEEIRLVLGSLDLAHAQKRDILSRFKVGAATHLDKVISNRQVLGFELQLKQKQAELATYYQDLSALTGQIESKNLESLSTTLANLSLAKISAPTEEQPQIKSLRLMSEYSDKTAAAQTAKLFPTINLFASTTLAYPNGPVLKHINQNTIGLTLSLPLYLGDPTWHLAESKRREAQAAKHRALQLQTDIHRDYLKSSELLASLKEQQKLANLDVLQSEEAAKLYYSSYQAGRGNLTDVQNANNQALSSKVNAARIDAQILNQLITLMALSGDNT